ncbi:hypothetical protein F5Y08DRAFT_340058 [Xylaria arbuscula]|nr:hypothetical protein F5Y08DRAFT_340058 [Xylaria arbuscula]
MTEEQDEALKSWRDASNKDEVRPKYESLCRCLFGPGVRVPDPTWDYFIPQYAVNISLDELGQRNIAYASRNQTSQDFDSAYSSRGTVDTYKRDNSHLPESIARSDLEYASTTGEWGNSDRTWLFHLAEKLLRDAKLDTLSDQALQKVANTLPQLLEDFARRLAYESSSQTHLEAAALIHDHRFTVHQFLIERRTRPVPQTPAECALIFKPTHPHVKTEQESIDKLWKQSDNKDNTNETVGGELGTSWAQGVEERNMSWERLHCYVGLLGFSDQFVVVVLGMEVL